MTSTSDRLPKIAALIAVLQPTQSLNAISLTDWLGEIEPAPAWLQLTRRNGVTQAIAVLSHPESYPILMQAILQQVIRRQTAVEWQSQCYELTGVSANTCELNVIEIPLFSPKKLPLALAGNLRDRCLIWLSKADATLAEKYRTGENFSLTFSLKPSSSKAILRIGILQPELLAPLLWGMREDMGSAIALDGVDCQLGNSLEIRHSRSFKDLWQIPSQSRISLEFLTQTSFKQRQIIQPFPLPDLVFSSLWRRWNAIAPPEYQLSAIAWEGFTSAYDLQTDTIQLKNSVEIGTKGWVRYEFTDAEQAKIATILAHFATFAGVGRKTAMGMGQTRIIAN